MQTTRFRSWIAVPDCNSPIHLSSPLFSPPSHATSTCMCQHAAPNHSPASCYYRIHEPRPSPFSIKQKNKYDHYKWHLETRHTSAQSKPLKLAHFLRLCNAILKYCVRASQPNLSKPSCEKQPEDNCTPVKSVSTHTHKKKSSTVTGSHAPHSDEQAESYLDVMQLFGPSLVFCWQKDKTMCLPACLDWPWEGEAGWEEEEEDGNNSPWSQVRLGKVLCYRSVRFVLTVELSKLKFTPTKFTVTVIVLCSCRHQTWQDPLHPLLPRLTSVVVFVMAGSDKIGHHSELTPLTQDCGLLTIFAKAHTLNPWGETSLWVLNSLWKKNK